MNHVHDNMRVKELVDRVARGCPGGHHGHQPGHRGGGHPCYHLGRRVTRLGSHLEYADDATLMRALEGRRGM